MIFSIIVWLIGLFLVPKALKPLGDRYGVLTVGGLILWTLTVMAVVLFFDFHLVIPSLIVAAFVATVIMFVVFNLQ